jgi:hypothetical protein
MTMHGHAVKTALLALSTRYLPGPAPSERYSLGVD